MENSTSEYNAYQMPRQKVSLKQKGEKWQRECVDAALHQVGIYGNNRRSTKFAKQANYDLYNGKFNKADLEYSTNPLGVQLTGMNFPASMQPYDCWNPIFQTLFGEEAKRQMSFVVRAINEDAITEKEDKVKEEILAMMTQILQAHLEDPKQAQKLEEQLHKYDKHSYQDMRESIATKILTYLRKDLKLDDLFQKGWEDALIGGEEIYAIETFGGEPSVRRVNPLEVYFQLPHNSDLIDDAETIVETTFMSVSQIIDNFYDKLKPYQIDELEGKTAEFGTNFTYTPEVAVFDTGYANYNSYSSVYDHKGNLRICKITWKSKKKVGELSYIDPETGEQHTKIVSEYYKEDKSNPNETVDWFWINEYWEGYKIGDDMYIDIKPKKEQYRRMDNISRCRSGYVGTVYNCNNSQSVSLMDRLKPFIYLYIILWYNTELAMATNMGKIALIDTSLIPDGWEVEKWLYYARSMKIGFVNSFNEGKKGQATGKLAGNFNQNRELDLETGNYIQSHIKLLEFIENKIKTLAGVSDQRMGQISPSELVGNTERAVFQSSVITERWFQIHNATKQRVLECLIEAAKGAWENKSKKVQYVLDDMSTVFFAVDGNEFINSEYGVFVSNAAKDQEALQTVKTMLQAAIQNDKADLSTVVDVINSDSIADVRAKLIKSEETRAQRAQEQVQQQSQLEQQMHQEKLDFEHEKLDREDNNKQLDRENKIQIEEIRAYSFDKEKDYNNNGIPDYNEQATIALKQQELSFKQSQESLKQSHEQKKHQEELTLKKEELKLKKEIEQKKIDAIHVQNQSQEKIAEKQTKLKEKELKAKEVIERLKLRAAKAKASSAKKGKK